MPAAVPGLVVAEEVAHLPLAVGAGGADVLLGLGFDAVGEGLEDLAELQPPRDPRPPVREVQRAARRRSRSRRRSRGC